MTPQLTDDQRQAIEREAGAPVYIFDSATNTSYVLMPAKDYEKLKSLTELDDVSSIYPLLADVAPEDWEDISNYENRP